MFLVCDNCKKCLHVVGDSAELKELLEARDVYPCYACGEPCTSAPFADSSLLRELQVIELSPMEAHLALEGMGLPSERECAAEIVRALFRENKVKDVAVRAIPHTGRSVVDSVEFVDGTTLFLGSSAHGALVYRIRKPHSYTETTLGAI